MENEDTKIALAALEASSKKASRKEPRRSDESASVTARKPDFTSAAVN